MCVYICVCGVGYYAVMHSTAVALSNGGEPFAGWAYLANGTYTHTHTYTTHTHIYVQCPFHCSCMYVCVFMMCMYAKCVIGTNFGDLWKPTQCITSDIPNHHDRCGDNNLGCSHTNSWYVRVFECVCAFVYRYAVCVCVYVVLTS